MIDKKPGAIERHNNWYIRISSCANSHHYGLTSLSVGKIGAYKNVTERLHGTKKRFKFVSLDDSSFDDAYINAKEYIDKECLK